MKVLILSPRLPHAHAYSGIQMIYQRMIRLLNRGYQVGLACFVDQEQDAPFKSQVSSDLCEIAYLPPPPLNRILPSAFISGRYSTSSSFFRYHSNHMNRLVGDMVARTGYDVVIAEFPAMAQCLLHNPYLPAVRKIVSCHDSPTLGSKRQMDLMDAGYGWGKQYVEYRHMKLLEFGIYRRMDRVLTLTAQERIDLLEEDPTLSITTVVPGLSHQVFQPMLDLPKEHCVTITGRFSSDQSQYGCLWFLRSVWPILRERDPKVKLYLVGRDPTPEMRRHAKRDGRVIVTGPVQDLRPFLAKSKVYVCPVLTGSGVRGKILEAMAMKLPVVSTTIGSEGIPVDQGSNAFLADSPDVMAGCIHLLLQDEGKRDQMGARARNAVETWFDWGVSMDDLERVLSEVISKRSFHTVA